MWRERPSLGSLASTTAANSSSSISTTSFSSLSSLLLRVASGSSPAFTFSMALSSRSCISAAASYSSMSSL